MKKVCIITLCWNHLDEATKPFIESLYKFTDTKKFDLIIIDNGSTDGTKKYLKEISKKYNNIEVASLPKNLGYAGGNNVGLKIFLERNKKNIYDFVGLLNNDILFTPDWLEDTLKGFSFDEQVGIVSPRSNEHCRLTPKNYLNGYKKFLKRFKGNLKYNITPFFSCVLIKREVVEKVGLLDETFNPAFWEDNDYSFRALYAGYNCAYVNGAFIFHNHSTTSKSTKSEISERNKQYFFKKHPLGKWVWEHKKSSILKDFIRVIKEHIYK